MKKIFSTLLLFALVQQSWAQFINVSVETLPLADQGPTNDGIFTDGQFGIQSYDLSGHTRYRIFANVTNENDAVFGIFALGGTTPDSPVSIRTSTNFFHYTGGFGGASMQEQGLGTTVGCNNIVSQPTAVDVLAGDFPGAALTSYITAGRVHCEYNGYSGPLTVAFLDPSDPIGTFLGNPSTAFDGGDLEFTEGAVIALPQDGFEDGEYLGPLGGDDLRVELGQFTTDGDFSFEINVQTGEAFDGTAVSNTQFWFHNPEGAIQPNPDANTPMDGSERGLIYPGIGCTNPLACNYNAVAQISDEDLCVFGDCPGCMDTVACNYNLAATEDDGSCVFEDPDNCLVCNTNGGLELFDENNDGCCDSETVAGCTDETAINYVPCATNDDASCIYAGCNTPGACNYVAGTQDSEPSLCEYDSCAGCMDDTAANYNAAATIDSGSCVFASCGTDSPLEQSFCYPNWSTESIAYTALAGQTVTLVINAGTTEDNFDMFNIYEGTDNTGVLRYSQSEDHAGVVVQSEVDGTLFLEWLSDGSVSCTSGTEVEFDYTVFCASISGCTDPNASNYDEDVAVDNGSCEYRGCTDELACNYNEFAQEDDESCLVAVEDCSDCVDGALQIVDSDGDGTCDAEDPFPNDPLDGLEPFSGLEGIFVEEYYNSGDATLEELNNFPDGMTTYRVYADLTDGYGLMAYFGLSNQPLEVLTTTSFYNAEIGANQADNFPEIFLQFSPESAFDSWFSFGNGSVNNEAIPLSLDTDGNVLGHPLGVDGLITNSIPEGYGFQISGDFNLSGLNSGEAPIVEITDGLARTDDLMPFSASNTDNMVLLGQFTTDGIFSFNLNLVISAPNGVQEEYVFENPDEDQMEFDFLSYVGFECSDETACNYNEASVEGTTDCCYTDCGCTDENATNYDASATCSTETCLYAISGLVFFDENENGIYEADTEYPLPFQTVTLQPGGVVGITNDEGQFLFENLESGSYNVTVSSNEQYPFSTTEATVNTSTFASTDPIFGLSTEAADFAICVDLYPTGGYLCDFPVNHNICYRNMGNLPISGTVALEYDPLFQEFISATNFVSQEGNIIYMSFENLQPGQMFFYDVVLQSPTVEYIGTILELTATVRGFYEGEEVAFGEKTLLRQLTCAYDPNDKQVFPNGFSEEHFVPQDQELEYLVRFQNTGNAFATDVRVTDIIDINLDLNTFQLVANSHSVHTTINPETRQVDFYFENIQLPDSFANEPESHGLVSFKIRPMPDTPLLTEINNTADIFFDNNPAVVTNTTWTTLFGCELMTGSISALPEMVCMGDELIIESETEYATELSWTIGEETAGTEANFTLDTSSPVESMNIGFVYANPMCSVAINPTTIEVLPLPEAPSISWSGTMLSTPEQAGSTYQWYLDGEAIDGATDFEWLPMEDGNYYVEVFNSAGCAQTGEAFFATSISSVGKIALALMPNPMQDNATLDLGDNFAQSKVELIDALGRVVRTYDNVSEQTLKIERENLSAGQYLLRVQQNGAQTTLRLTVE